MSPYPGSSPGRASMRHRYEQVRRRAGQSRLPTLIAASGSPRGTCCFRYHNPLKWAAWLVRT